MPDQPLPLHPVVAKLVPTPGKPIPNIRLIGYLGASSRAGHVRLYSNLANLSRWLDLPESSILHVASVPEAAAQHEASYVWVRSDAAINLPRPSSTKLADFLRGSIMTQAAARQGQPTGRRAAPPVICNLSGTGFGTDDGGTDDGTGDGGTGDGGTDDTGTDDTGTDDTGTDDTGTDVGTGTDTGTGTGTGTEQVRVRTQVPVRIQEQVRTPARERRLRCSGVSR